MKVGINYPWLHCGWDFGPTPPGYGSRAGHFETIAADLARLAACGVSIVRWFVLADGFVYGTGQHAPQRKQGQFRFGADAPLAPSFLTDFERLLQLCEDHGLQLLPVLLDFHCAFPGLDCQTREPNTLRLWDRTPRGMWNQARLQAARERAARLPPGYVKGGRRDVLLDAPVGARFFDNVLTPLLQLSQRHRSAIYAWELFNEPEWITASMPLHGLFSREKRVPLARMQSFLRAGLARIREHGFLPTVGFARAGSIARWDTPSLGLALNQPHYYPRGLLSSLHDARFANGLPSVLGELASHPSLPRAWPDLPQTHQSPHARLALAQQLGYQAALLWSYRATDRATDPAREAVEHSISEFVRSSGRQARFAVLRRA